MAQDFQRGQQLTAERLNRLVTDVGALARMCALMPPSRRASGLRRRWFDNAGELSFIREEAQAEGEDALMFAELSGMELVWQGGSALLEPVRTQEPLPDGEKSLVSAYVYRAETAHPTALHAASYSPVALEAAVSPEGEVQREPLLMGRVDRSAEGCFVVQDCVPWLSEQGVVAWCDASVTLPDGELLTGVLPAKEAAAVWVAGGAYMYDYERGMYIAEPVCLCACLDCFGYLRLSLRKLEVPADEPAEGDDVPDAGAGGESGGDSEGDSGGDLAGEEAV